MEKLVYHNYALNRDYTQEEWWQLCREVDILHDTAFEHNGFRFNYCDVCLNPNKPIRNDKFEMYISTADTGDGWVYGFQLYLGNGGGSGPCVITSNRFSTEDEAICEALKRLEYMAIHSNGERAKAALRYIHELQFEREHPQLSLF